MDLKDIRLYVDDRPAEGVFRVHRDVYSDPELHELEHKYIFERTWNFLALESQIAKPNDFVTAHIGRTPVLATRDAKGRLCAFVNVCRHKGAMLCAAEEGNAKYHVCPYHGWAYDASGKNVDIKDRKTGSYPPSFEAEDHNLVPLARVASYKGFIFGSLSDEVPPLEDFLGPTILGYFDRLFDGRALTLYGYNRQRIPGNWKLMQENIKDPYHPGLLHTWFVTFGLWRADNKSQLVMDAQHRHAAMISTRGQMGKADEARKSLEEALASASSGGRST